MDINKLCPHCMKERNENQNICPFCGYNMNSPKEIQHQLKPFTILAGKYLIGDVLGEGGFGITYIGLDINLEIPIAIKEFYPNGFATRESQVTNELTVYTGQGMDDVYKWRDNFVKEARSLAKCSHLSGIVGVKDFFQENNTAYIVMEYLEGMTLKEYAKSLGGKISPDQLLTALKPVMVSLGEVHKEGLIHRDISPDNIMLLKGGQMKLLDFGAARDYTAAGEKSLSVMLKPGYAPEEQYRSKGQQGPWSDIYALAATVYKCITGVTPPEAMERMRKDELVKPSDMGIIIENSLETALLKAMEIYAENRYQNMEDFCCGIYCEDIQHPAVEKSGVPTVGPESFSSLDDKKEENVKGSNLLMEIALAVKEKKKLMGIAVAAILVVCILASWKSFGSAPENGTEIENADAIADAAMAREQNREGENDAEEPQMENLNAAEEEPTAYAPQSENVDGASLTREERIIADQSFDVEFLKWGEVSFVSYAPENPGVDVSFELQKNGETKYILSAYYENNMLPEGIYFVDVEEVFFDDYNHDGAADIMINNRYSDGNGEFCQCRVYRGSAEGDFYFQSVLSGMGDSYAKEAETIWHFKEDLAKRYSNEELPFSDSIYWTENDLHMLTPEQLSYARNEIYARHGYIFQDGELYKHFISRSWYVPSVAEVPETMLNEYEISNRDLIIQLESYKK